MSRIRADKFVNRAATGAPELTYGAQVVTGYGITGAGGINITGVATANSFSGGWSGALSLTDTTASSSTSTGALIVSGGAGIAKSVYVGGNLDVTGAVSVGGTVTYEDVTNVDSIGVVTARLGVIATAGRGVEITAGGLNVTAGIATFKGVGNFDAEVTAAGGVDVAGGVKVGAALTVVGALDVDGATTLDAVTIAEEVTASGGIDVTGGVKVGAALTVVGALDVDGVTTLDAVTVGETLAITQETTASGGVDINGGLDVAGVGTFATGVKLTGGAITAGTGATIFSPASNVITAGTASTEVVRINANAGILLNNGILAERVKIDSDSINSDKFIRLQDGMVHYRSSAVGAASVKPDIVSTTGINTDMGIGDTIAVTLITVAGNTAHFVSSVAIDGRTTGISTYWTGGSIPTAGGGSNVDIYAFNILKTADNTFTVIANQTMTS